MEKIPVGETLRGAYEFTFANYLRLIGVSWVSSALLFALMLWQVMPYTAAMAAAPGDAGAALFAVSHLLLFEAGSFFLLTVLALGYAKVALDRPVRWPFFYLGFDGDFWWLLLNFFFVLLILMAALFVISLVMAAVLGVFAGSMLANQAQAAPAMQGYAIIAATVIYAVMAFVFVRFAIFLPAIVVVEKGLGIGRNWALSSGNFFRLLVVFIGALLPVIGFGVGTYVVAALFGGPQSNVLNTFGSQAASLALSAHIMGFYAQYWYAMALAMILLSPLLYGPLFAAGALAYRAQMPVSHADAFS
ncbi:MAG TPA: hypothetical protein VGG48_02070 [Rhizomicrobium sp.]|jgi:hypothetical protein